MALSTLPIAGVTARDYWRFPEDVWKRRIELLEGVIVVNPSASFYHQTVSMNLSYELETWNRKTKAGYVLPNLGMEVATDSVPVPDILFVSHQRVNLLQKKGMVGAADLVVEILSPRNRLTDLVQKRRIYAAAGVREYWIVDPKLSAIEVLILKDNAYSSQGVITGRASLSSPILGKTKIPLSRIFRS